MRELVNSITDQMLQGERSNTVAYDFTTLYEKLKLWMCCGSKTFRLSKELIDAFALTDVPLDVRPSDFKFPFGVFLIEGEKPLYQVKAHGNNNVDVHALLFTDKSSVDANEGNLFITRDGTFKKGLDWDISISGLSPGYEGYGLDHMWVNMCNGDTIREACQLSRQLVDIRDTVSMPEAQRAANIFFNTIMYINDPTRVPEETQSLGHAKIKVDGKKKFVRTEYIYLRPPKRYIPIPGAGTGRTIDKRFVVRGHHRKQAYGKGRTERKRIWIMPFWKGPEMAEIVSKKYKVE